MGCLGRVEADPEEAIELSRLAPSCEGNKIVPREVGMSC